MPLIDHDAWRRSLEPRGLPQPELLSRLSDEELEELLLTAHAGQERERAVARNLLWHAYYRGFHNVALSSSASGLDYPPIDAAPERRVLSDQAVPEKLLVDAQLSFPTAQGGSIHFLPGEVSLMVRTEVDPRPPGFQESDVLTSHVEVADSNGALWTTSRSFPADELLHQLSQECHPPVGHVTLMEGMTLFSDRRDRIPAIGRPEGLGPVLPFAYYSKYLTLEFDLIASLESTGGHYLRVHPSSTGGIVSDPTPGTLVRVGFLSRRVLFPNLAGTDRHDSRCGERASSDSTTLAPRVFERTAGEGTPQRNVPHGDEGLPRPD